jgi:Flp pilus assembly protein CpaB
VLLARRSDPRPRPVPGRAPAWQRRLRRQRRGLAAVLAAASAVALGTALHPAAAPTTSVVVARHDLTPGTAITDADVATEPRPVTGLPADVLTSPAGAVNRTVAFPVRSGEPVSARHVVGAGLLAASGPGTVAATVTLADPAAVSLVQAGDLVDVIAATAASTGDGGATTAAASSVVASRVRVLVSPGAGATSSGGLLGSTPSTTASRTTLVLATSSDQALALACAAVGARLSVVVLGS